MDYVLDNKNNKILVKSTKSYLSFIEEAGNLHFFLLYILLAEHTEVEEKKQSIIKDLGEEKNVAVQQLIDFLESDKSNNIFKAEAYELYFGQMAFARLVDNALSYLKEVLGEVILSRPEILKSNEKESLEYILKFESYDQLISNLTKKKINQLLYGSLKDIKTFFKIRLGINLFENNKQEKEFDMLLKQRNLIVHNRGVISQKFIDDFNLEQDLLSKSLNFQYSDLSNLNSLINEIIIEIDLKIREKFELEFVSI